MNSFIAWVGGKKLLRKAIIDSFPTRPINRYIEVFGGAGWVLFAKNGHAPIEVFNDIDGNLINMYRCIKYHCGEFQRELQYTLNSREQFSTAKQQLNMAGMTDIQRAARYFTVIKCSFGADRRSFGTNKRNIKNTIEYLPQIEERLRTVVIENRDFENLIKTYDRPDSLFYLDPPYYGAEDYYDNDFPKNDHIRLCEILKHIKGYFVLSYNDSEFVRDLYQGFQIKEVSRLDNLAIKTGVKKYAELIITNF